MSAPTGPPRGPKDRHHHDRRGTSGPFQGHQGPSQGHQGPSQGQDVDICSISDDDTNDSVRGLSRPEKRYSASDFLKTTIQESSPKSGRRKRPNSPERSDKPHKSAKAQHGSPEGSDTGKPAGKGKSRLGQPTCSPKNREAALSGKGQCQTTNLNSARTAKLGPEAQSGRCESTEKESNGRQGREDSKVPQAANSVTEDREGMSEGENESPRLDKLPHSKDPRVAALANQSQESTFEEPETLATNPGGNPVSRSPLAAELGNDSDGWQQVSRKQRNRHPKPSPPAPPPTFCEFPVILTDATDGKLRKLQWDLDTILRDTVGEVRTIRNITRNNKGHLSLVVGCSSSLQQQRLARTDTVKDVAVKCRIPTPTVTGVIKGIPLHLQPEEIMRRAETECRIKSAKRLTLRNGEPSRAVLLALEACQLPETVTVCKRVLTLEPYRHPIIQCHNCQGLGHKTKECRRNKPVCATCGHLNHRRAECKATAHKCANCQGPHPATAPHCPAKKDQALANKIRSTTYIGKMAALNAAKRAKSPTPVAALPHTSQAPTMGWKGERSFSDVLQGRERTAAAGVPTPTPSTPAKNSKASIGHEDDRRPMPAPRSKNTSSVWQLEDPSPPKKQAAAERMEQSHHRPQNTESTAPKSIEKSPGRDLLDLMREMYDAQRRDMEQLKRELAFLVKQVQDLQSENKALREENTAIKNRLQHHGQ